MAYSFSAGSQQYFSAGFTVAEKPFTASVLFSPSNVTVISDLLTINKFDVQEWYMRLLFRGDVANDPVDFFGFHTGLPTTTSPRSSVGLSLNTWARITGVANSANLRAIYVNDLSATNTTAEIGYVASTNTIIGAFIRQSGSQNYCSGLLSECAIWNVALTDAEIASMAKGFTPRRIRPQSLVFYAPLIRAAIDAKGGLTLTPVNSPTVADHPRVYP